MFLYMSVPLKQCSCVNSDTFVHVDMHIGSPAAVAEHYYRNTNV